MVDNLKIQNILLQNQQNRRGKGSGKGCAPRPLPSVSSKGRTIKKTAVALLSEEQKSASSSNGEKGHPFLNEENENSILEQKMQQKSPVTITDPPVQTKPQPKKKAVTQKKEMVFT